MNGNQDILAKFISGSLDRAERLEAIYPSRDDVSELLIAVRPADYSASLIAKAVEDCDMQLLGLSVTAMRTEEGLPVVALRVAASDSLGVERSLARYGFEVLHSADADDTEARAQAVARAQELIHLLEL